MNDSNCQTVTLKLPIPRRELEQLITEVALEQLSGEVSQQGRQDMAYLLQLLHQGIRPPRAA